MGTYEQEAMIMTDNDDLQVWQADRFVIEFRVKRDQSPRRLEASYERGAKRIAEQLNAIGVAVR
jgi:hypothetical protein